MYDVAIIGAGPAGISAALTLKNLNRNFVLFGSDELSEKILKSERIANYPGVGYVSGKEFVGMLKKQLNDCGISVTCKRINNVFFIDGKFMLLSGDEMIEACAVIYAGGTESIKHINGEAEFLGKGVSYCATCDGFLYKGKTLAIVAESEKFEPEVEFLSSLAEKTYVCRLYKGDLPPVEICGDVKVNSIRNGNGDVIPVDGVFVLKNCMAASDLIKGVVSEDGHVVTDRSQETSLKGCFAAGDCVGAPYQIAKAVGEGNVAAHSAVTFLAAKNKLNHAKTLAK